MNVLIVDDEPLVRRSLVRAFEIKGHTVYEGADGTEGIKIWNEKQPELVILDVLMPGLSGPQVIAQMDIQKRKQAKVILVSAYTGEYNKGSAKNLGADLFIEKPFADIFKVVEVATDLLGKS